MAGSLTVISIGLISASIRTALGLRPSWSISLCAFSLWSPVNFRRRSARRRRRLGVDVSGIKRNMRSKIGPASHRISHSDQRQPFAVTAKPDNRGPREGPQYAAETQKVIAYGSLSREYISCMVAPELARHGEPKKPCRNRRTSRPAKLSTSAVGSDRMTKMKNVAT